jgi:hypothetical protein
MPARGSGHKADRVCNSLEVIGIQVGFGLLLGDSA